MPPRLPRLRDLLVPALACTLVACAARGTAPGEASAPAKRPAPQAPATLHVLALKTYVYREPQRGPQIPPFVSLPIAARVVVASEPVPGTKGGPFRRIVEGEGAGGFVPEEDLQAEAPSAPDALERARTFLGEGKLDDAVTWGTRSAALDASSREAWDLLAAIHDARGDVNQARPVYASRSRLAALPAPAENEPRWPTPAVGEPRYSSATKLRVRARPHRKAKVLAELELNTRVDVLGVEGEFTRISWMAEARNLWVVHLGGENGANAEASARKEGWVGTAYLAPAATPREALLARADEAEPQGHFVETARALERAALVAPGDGALLQRLTRVAARARLYPLAATSALQGAALASPTASGGSAGVSINMYFGCRQAPPPKEYDACTRVFDTLGSEPPDQPGDAGDEVGGDPDRTKEELAEENAANQERYARELAEYERERRKLEAETQTLRKQYPSGPWVNVSISGSRELHEAGKQVFVYSVPFEIAHECDIFTGGAEFKALRFSREPRPWPTGGETLEIWVTGGGYEGTLYGVVAARSEAEARELIMNGADSDAPESDGYSRSVSSPEDLVHTTPIIAGPWRDGGGCAC